MAILAQKNGVQKCFSARAWELAQLSPNEWEEIGVCEKTPATFGAVQGNNYVPPRFGSGPGVVQIVEVPVEVIVEVPVPTGITNFVVN